MGRFKLLWTIALRNLRSHRMKTVVVTGIVSLGMFVAVFGLSFVSSMETAMRRAVTLSITGQIQVWSDESDDELRLIDLTAEEPDIGELPQFEAVEQQLTGIPGVTHVVPMASGTGNFLSQSETDAVLERLSEGVRSGAGGETSVAIERIRLIASQLEQSLQHRRRLNVDSGEVRDALKVVRRVESDEFWDEFGVDPDSGLAFLDNEFAPLAPSADPMNFNYIATDPGQFREVFDRFRVVDGQMIPPGRRGIMIPKRFYERMMKNRTALELDALSRRIEAGERISESPTLQSAVKGLQRRANSLAVQVSADEAAELHPQLQALPGVDGPEFTQLLLEFLTLDDDNFERRYAFFYDAIAPMIELYTADVGDVVVARGFTSTGYLRAVEVRFYGTFEFEGLEESGLAGSKPLMDLVTFRQLYGKMTALQLEELDEIRSEIAVESVGRSAVEESLFGEGAGDVEVETAAEDSPDEGIAGESPDDELFPAFEVETNRLDDREYSDAEMRGGVAMSAAVFVEDPEKIEETIDAIDAIPGLQATDWRAAAGIIGRSATVLTGILYVAVLLIFLVALVIINNSMLMATIERVPEIGTIRAIGGHRTDVLQIVLFESVAVAAMAAVIGGGLGVGAIWWLGAVGVPAPSGVVALLFGGDTLYPAVTLESFAIAVGVVGVTTLVSTLYPAHVAIRVEPVIAMRGAS